LLNYEPIDNERVSLCSGVFGAEKWDARAGMHFELSRATQRDNLNGTLLNFQACFRQIKHLTYCYKPAY